MQPFDYPHTTVFHFVVNIILLEGFIIIQYFWYSERKKYRYIVQNNYILKHLNCKYWMHSVFERFTCGSRLLKSNHEIIDQALNDQIDGILDSHCVCFLSILIAGNEVDFEETAVDGSVVEDAQRLFVKFQHVRQEGERNRRKTNDFFCIRWLPEWILFLKET